MRNPPITRVVWRRSHPGARAGASAVLPGELCLQRTFGVGEVGRLIDVEKSMRLIVKVDPGIALFHAPCENLAAAGVKEVFQTVQACALA